MHAYNKLNAVTISAQVPIPRRNVFQNNMVGCTVFSALDLVDGYYQQLMRASNIPLTAPQAVCFASGLGCHKGCLITRQRLIV